MSLPQSVVTPKESLISSLKHRDLLFTCPSWLGDNKVHARRLTLQDDTNDDCVRRVNCPNNECVLIDTEHTEEVIQPNSSLPTSFQSGVLGLQSIADIKQEADDQELRLGPHISTENIVRVNGLSDALSQRQANAILNSATSLPNNYLTDSDLFNLLNPDTENMLALGAGVSAASTGIFGVYEIETQAQGAQQLDIMHGNESQLNEMLTQYSQNVNNHQHPLLFFSI